MSAFPISGPLSLGDLLDRTFRLYRARFGLFVRTAALFLVPMLIVTGLLTGASSADSFALLAGMMTGDVSTQPTSGAGTEGWVFLLSILSLLVNGFVVLVLTRQSIDALHGEEQPMSQSLLTGWQRLWTYIRMIIWQGLVYFAVTTGLLLVLGILFFLIIAAATVVGLSLDLDSLLNFDSPAGIVAAIGAGILLFCGYILAVILVMLPTIYYSSRWIVALPVLLDGEWRAREALRRSWALTEGHLWRAVGYSVLLALLSFFVASLPVIVAQLATTALFMADQMFLAVALSTTVSAIFSILWVPFNSSALVLLYYDLRVRKESYDLDLRIDQMAAALDKENAETETGSQG